MFYANKNLKTNLNKCITETHSLSKSSVRDERKSTFKYQYVGGKSGSRGAVQIDTIGIKANRFCDETKTLSLTTRRTTRSTCNQLL